MISQFKGFPLEGFKFLSDLALNNNREWFKTNKEYYQEYLLDPGQSFVYSLGQKLQEISIGLRYDTQTNGRGSIMRIHRDIRFSKDKSPYHTRFRVVFWEGSGKKMQHPGIFFGMDINGGGLYQGMYGFSKPILNAYREAIHSDEQGEELVNALQNVRKTGDYKIGGSQYKRVPRGFDPSHKRAELLKYKGLYGISPRIDIETLQKPDLVDICFEHCKNMAPLHHWLVNIDQSI